MRDWKHGWNLVQTIRPYTEWRNFCGLWAIPLIFPPVSGTGTPVASYVANLDVAYSLLAGELKFSE